NHTHIFRLGLYFRGTAIAAAISKNVQDLEGDFDERVHIYVYDDATRNSLLSEVINNSHENVKYLPGIKLPKNLIAVNDLLEAAQNADILIFSIPHTFVKSYCNILAGNVKETAFAVSMVKGLMQERDDEMVLVSDTISDQLDIPCYSMMSAHSSMEMAQGKLCEVTVGCDDAFHVQLLTAILQTNNCRVISIDDVTGVELCGTLNEIISLGAGFVDGQHLGDNTRVAAIHLCVKEMMRFIKTFFPSVKMSTFYETCGIANSVAATYVDKNVNFAQSFIATGKTFEEMEANFLHGRKLLGPVVAAEVNAFLEKALMQHEFPLFTAIHRICQNEAPPELMLDALRNHPDLSGSSISHLLSNETAPAQEKMDMTLDQVANALPKLRSCLDKILVEANSPNLKNLKVMDDWAQVDEHKVEHLGLQMSSANILTETGEIPSRLSAEASRIRDEIQKGNVQVGFKMDAREGGRHIRLLLQELPEKCTNKAVISSESDKIGSELDQGHNNMNESSDVLDLSNEDTRKEVNIKVQDNLIKSIRQTIEALENKEKMDNFIAQSRMKDENSSFARFYEDDNHSADEDTEMRQVEMNARTEARNKNLLSDSDEQSFQRERENPVKLRLHDDVEAALSEVSVLDDSDHSVTNERTELEELQQWQKLKTNAEEDSPKLFEGQDPAALEDITKPEELADVDMTELPIKEKDEQRLVTVGNRKPNKNLSKVNVRHFRNKKFDYGGRHEWDWMLNHKIDTDELLASEKDETLSKSDQEGLERLHVQLQEALQRDFDVMASSHDDAPNQELAQDTDLETKSDNKRITQEPVIPLPLKLPTPKKHYREGTPEIPNPPGNIPPPMRESKPRKDKKMQPHRTMPPVEFGDVFELQQPEKADLDEPEKAVLDEPEKAVLDEPEKAVLDEPEKAVLDEPELETKKNFKTEPQSEPPYMDKSQGTSPPPEEIRWVSDLPKTKETTTHSDERSVTPKKEESREGRYIQTSQDSSPEKKSPSVLRKGRHRQVDYRGQNPFTMDPEPESKLPLDTNHNRDMGNDGLSHQRRKVVVSPPFNPPLNPRVRVPRPPFDVRDHEYHTMVARPAINPLAPAIKWSSFPRTQKPPLVATIQVKQFTALPIKVPSASQYLLQIPSGMPRTPTLTKILCALQIGLLASYLARSKK
ncbi:hypothetical protein KR038_010161, partial [Drosophila bunnanda]